MHIPYTQFITCCFVGQRLYYNITMLNAFLIELAAKKFWPPARARRKGGVGGIPPRPSVPPERSGGGQFRSKKVRAELYNSTNRELNGFFDGYKRTAQSADQGFFGGIAREFRISGAQARLAVGQNEVRAEKFFGSNLFHKKVALLCNFRQGTCLFYPFRHRFEPASPLLFKTSGLFLQRLLFA